MSHIIKTSLALQHVIQKFTSLYRAKEEKKDGLILFIISQHSDVYTVTYFMQFSFHLSLHFPQTLTGKYYMSTLQGRKF